MRAAVYSGTRNLYPDMVTAAKSLIFNSNVEKVYFLIEDEKFPEDLPPIIETLDVSKQTYFPEDSANFRTRFTYMSLLRVCYSKLFPGLPKVLQLDVDTICVDDVSDLWDTDLDGKWFAACSECLGTYKPYGQTYYNIGVAMFNLDQIRMDRTDDWLIRFLNETPVPYIDQDAWNWVGCMNRGVDLPVRYNECFVTGFTDQPAIVHFAGAQNWQDDPKVQRREYIRQYREKNWDEVLQKNKERRAVK